MNQGQQRSPNCKEDVKNWRYGGGGNIEEVSFVDEASYQKAQEEKNSKSVRK